jgi:hypothetical protein
VFMWNWFPRGAEDALEHVQKGRVGRGSEGTGLDGIDLL